MFFLTEVHHLFEAMNVNIRLSLSWDGFLRISIKLLNLKLEY